MHLNLSQEHYKELEDAIKKIASREDIDNIESIELAMFKDKGFLKFNKAELNDNSFLSQVLAEIDYSNFSTREAKINFKKMTSNLLNSPYLGSVIDYIIEQGKLEGFDKEENVKPILEYFVSKASPNSHMTKFFTNFLISKIMPKINEVSEAYSEFKGEEEPKKGPDEDIIDAEFKMEEGPEKIKRINPKKELEKLEKKEKEFLEEKDDPFSELNIDIEEPEESEEDLNIEIPDDYTPIGKAASIDKINSNSFLIKKEASSYSAIEESLIKFAKENNINDVEEIEIHINPISSYIKFKQSDNKERIVTAGVGDIPLIGTIGKLGQEYPKLTGLANVAATYAQNKIQGTSSGIFQTLVLPYLEGYLGGAYTAMAGRLAQGMGAGAGMTALLLFGGFVLDSLFRADMSEEEGEKKKHEEDAKKALNKATQNDPKLLNSLSQHVARMVKSGKKDYTLMDAFKEYAGIKGISMEEKG